MPIQLTGLSGGFDSSGIITQLVALAKAPLDALAAKKSQVDSAVSTMNTYTSRLTTLRANAVSMSDAAGYASYATTSSDTSVVASATGTAQAGSYDVTVTQLASIQKLRGAVQTSSSTALGMSGTLSIKVGTGSPIDIAVSATDTLGDIAASFAKSGARVAASVLYDGTNYHLSLQGLDTGAANAFTVAQTGLDLGLADPANVYQAAGDAKLTVDGLAITRPTNQIAGVLPGLTLALTKPGVSSSIRVSSDTTALKTKLNGFIASYNDIVNATHTATGYSTVKATNSVLAGDSSMRRALDGFARMVGSAVPGASGSFATLGSVGVKLAADGTLSFDATKFDAAVVKDPDSVRRLFITDTTSGATGIMKTMSSAVDALITGTKSPIKARIAALQATSTRLDTSAADKQKRVDDYEQQLRKQYAALDAAQSKYSAMSAAISGITNVNR